MKKAIFLSLFIFMASQSFAQVILGFNYKMYTPEGSFNDYLPVNPQGFSLDLLYHIPKSKFVVGAEFGIAMYAKSEYTIQTSSGIAEVYEEDCFWTLHADVRYFVYQKPMIKVYLQGRVGMTTFFSDISTTYSNNEYESDGEIHGAAFNFGFGGGVWVNVKSLFTNGKKEGFVNFDFGMALHSGSNSTYRYMPNAEPTASFSDGNYNSLTNYIDYRIGLIINPKWRSELK